MLTKGDFWADKKRASELLIIAGIDADLPKPEKPNLWNGRQIFSMVLPENLNFERSHDEFRDEKKLKIKPNIPLVSTKVKEMRTYMTFFLS